MQLHLAPEHNHAITLSLNFYKLDACYEYWDGVALLLLDRMSVHLTLRGLIVAVVW